MTTERVLCMCFGYVPIFIGGGEGLRVEQRGPVRGVQDPSLRDLLRSQKKWKIVLSQFAHHSAFDVLKSSSKVSGLLI